MKTLFNKIKKMFYIKDRMEHTEINKQLITIVVSIFITVISVIGVTYSAFVWSDNSVKNQSIVVGNVELAINSSSEALGSSLNYPVPSEEEELIEPYTFTIKNTGSLTSLYTIKLVADDAYTNTLDTQYIYMSLDGAKSITRTSVSSYESKALETGILSPGEERTYDLRLWIIENAPNSVIGQEWHGKIVLESELIDKVAYVEANDLTPIEDNKIKVEGAYETSFSITNTEDTHKKITIDLVDIKIADELKNKNFRWGLYNKDTENGLAFGIFKYTDKSIRIYQDMIIDAAEPDITRNFILRIWIHNDGTDQSSMLNKNFSADIAVSMEDIEYTPESCFTVESGTITDYDESCGLDVVIPKTIDGETVTSIYTNWDGEYYNSFTEISSIIIPDTVTNIYGGDFDDIAISSSKLKYITIPESVKSLFTALYIPNIEQVFIPDTIESFGTQAITGSPETIVINGNLFYDESVDMGYGSLVVKTENIIIMDGVTTIGRATFQNNTSLTTIEIPASVTSVEYEAFSGCTNLTEIVVRGKTSLSDFANSEGLVDYEDIIVFR